jgi:drug/metabolite transporter (DMT)-like permease
MSVSNNLRGIAATLVATGAFVANDSCMKLAMADAPPFQVLIMRGIAACLWCLPIVLAQGHGRDLKFLLNRWVLARSFSEVFAILCFALALKHMPIADITAITQITPFLVLIGVRLIWGDRIGPLRLFLIAIGIGGALLVAQPGTSAASPYAVLGFLTSAGAAGRDIFTRKIDTAIPALVVTFSTLITVMVAAVVCSLVFETQIMPTWRHAGLMAIAGFFLMCGHFFIFLAFRLAPARVVAPFFFSFMIWALVSGSILFNNIPNGLAVAGMIVILLTGLMVILLDGRRQRVQPA